MKKTYTKPSLEVISLWSENAVSTLLSANVQTNSASLTYANIKNY